MYQAELTQQYRELDRELALLSYRMNSEKMYEDTWFVPAPENLEAVRKELKALEQRTEALEAPDPVYAMVKHHLQDFVESQYFVIDGLESDPLGALSGFRFFYMDRVRLDSRPANVRMKKILTRLEQFQWNRDFFVELLKEKPEAERRGAVGTLKRTAEGMREECPHTKEYFPELNDLQAEMLTEALYAFIQECEDIVSCLDAEDKPQPKAEREDLSITVKMDGEKYREVLKSQLGVSLDELLAWYEPEMEKTRAEVFRIAAAAAGDEPVPKTMVEVNDMLFRHQPPAKDPEEMFARARSYLKRAREVAHAYVKLPEDEQCVCKPIPLCCRDSYPWGGYEGGDFLTQPLTGQMFLNQYNVSNISDGWIKMNAMHESYPGHHCQYIRAAVDTTPETVKIGAKMVPLLEGTCLRTERAFEDTFPEDPYYPLFVAYRRHHTSVRIYVDLQMFYFGATLQEAVDIYARELGLDYVTARAQVKAHENSPGYFTCYYYGMKKITDWEKELGCSKKDFTELCFSSGYVSIDTFEQFVRMTPEERARYATEFRSLLRK